MPTLYQTIVRPIVTEQSSMAYQERGEYTFEVHPDATKPAIRQAVESLTRMMGRRPLGWFCRSSPGSNTRRLVAEAAPGLRSEALRRDAEQ